MVLFLHKQARIRPAKLCCKWLLLVLLFSMVMVVMKHQKSKTHMKEVSSARLKSAREISRLRQLLQEKHNYKTHASPTKEMKHIINEEKGQVTDISNVIQVKFGLNVGEEAELVEEEWEELTNKVKNRSEEMENKARPVKKGAFGKENNVEVKGQESKDGLDRHNVSNDSNKGNEGKAKDTQDKEREGVKEAKDSNLRSVDQKWKVLPKAGGKYVKAKDRYEARRVSEGGKKDNEFIKQEITRNKETERRAKDNNNGGKETTKRINIIERKQDGAGSRKGPDDVMKDTDDKGKDRGDVRWAGGVIKDMTEASKATHGLIQSTDLRQKEADAKTKKEILTEGNGRISEVTESRVLGGSGIAKDTPKVDQNMNPTGLDKVNDNDAKGVVKHGNNYKNSPPVEGKLNPSQAIDNRHDTVPRSNIKTITGGHGLTLTLAVSPASKTGTYSLSKASAFAKTVQKTALNKTIIISVLDFAYLKLAINLLKTSFEPLGITNYIFICLSKEAKLGLEKYGVPCLVHEVLNENYKPSVFGSKAFIAKTLVKPLYVLEALKLGYDAMLVDLDIVFFKNPLKHVNCDNFDLCIQLDSIRKDRINSGFYLVHPTKSGIKVHQQIMDILGNDPTTRVQQVMQDLLIEMNGRGEMKTKPLDINIYPPGKIYFEKGHRMFKGENPCFECVLVHNNWIRHEAAKVFRMKETGLWKVDMDGYYSDPFRKYIMYSNPLDVGNLTASLERNALQVALIFGKLLNRTVILPKFTCHDCDSTICDQNRTQCPMNSQFLMRDFDKYFSGKYRESCFLEHELVPKSVKESKSPLLHINTVSMLERFADSNKLSMNLLQSQKLDKRAEIFTPQNLKQGASSDEIVNWFRNHHFENYSILHFHSLYFALTKLSNQHRDSDFEEPLSKGLTGADYRQNIIRHKFTELNVFLHLVKDWE